MQIQKILWENKKKITKVKLLSDDEISQIAFKKFENSFNGKVKQDTFVQGASHVRDLMETEMLLKLKQFFSAGWKARGKVRNRTIVDSDEADDAKEMAWQEFLFKGE